MKYLNTLPRLRFIFGLCPNNWTQFNIRNIDIIIVIIATRVIIILIIKHCAGHILDFLFLLVGGLEHFLFFHKVGNNNPNFHIFKRGRYTTKQFVRRYYYTCITNRAGREISKAKWMGFWWEIGRSTCWRPEAGTPKYDIRVGTVGTYDQR